MRRRLTAFLRGFLYSMFAFTALNAASGWWQPTMGHSGEPEPCAALGFPFVMRVGRMGSTAFTESLIVSGLAWNVSIALTVSVLAGIVTSFALPAISTAQRCITSAESPTARLAPIQFGLKHIFALTTATALVVGVGITFKTLAFFVGEILCNILLLFGPLSLGGLALAWPRVSKRRCALVVCIVGIIELAVILLIWWTRFLWGMTITPFWGIALDIFEIWTPQIFLICLGFRVLPTLKRALSFDPPEESMGDTSPRDETRQAPTMVEASVDFRQR